MEEITEELILKAPTPQNGETQTIRQQMVWVRPFCGVDA